MYNALTYVNEDKFTELCMSYEISALFAPHLRALAHYKVVLICDDSGSMKAQTEGQQTRWGELCQFVKTVFSVTEAIENSPLDVYFLNRGAVMNVQQLVQITEAFSAPPKGWTPIVPVLRQALNQACPVHYQGRLFIICTDGEPTDEENRANTNQLKQVLLYERRPTDYVNFLACTADDDAIGYLNEWDNAIARVDVSDDYQSERREVLRAQGSQFRFSYGDYVVKALMGSVVPELDRLDEAPSRWTKNATTPQNYGVSTQCGPQNGCTQQ